MGALPLCRGDQHGKDQGGACLPSARCRHPPPRREVEKVLSGFSSRVPGKSFHWHEAGKGTGSKKKLKPPSKMRMLLIYIVPATILLAYFSLRPREPAQDLQSSPSLGDHHLLRNAHSARVSLVEQRGQLGPRSASAAQDLGGAGNGGIADHPARLLSAYGGGPAALTHRMDRWAATIAAANAGFSVTDASIEPGDVLRGIAADSGGLGRSGASDAAAGAPATRQQLPGAAVAAPGGGPRKLPPMLPSSTSTRSAARTGCVGVAAVVRVVCPPRWCLIPKAFSRCVAH